MRYYAWINCGETDSERATPCVEASDTPPHGFEHATRRGEGATEEDALAELARDVAAWDAIHDAETEES